MASTTSENPLLREAFCIPFDRIKAEHVEPAVAELLKGARERLSQLSANNGANSYGQVMHPLDRLTEPLDYAMGIVRHLESVATYPELRAAFNGVQPEVSTFYSGIPLHAGLWTAVKAYAAGDEARSLTGERRRYLDKTVESFRRHGADLDAAGKKRL